MPSVTGANFVIEHLLGQLECYSKLIPDLKSSWQIMNLSSEIHNLNDTSIFFELHALRFALSSFFFSTESFFTLPLSMFLFSILSGGLFLNCPKLHSSVTIISAGSYFCSTHSLIAVVMASFSIFWL